MLRKGASIRCRGGRANFRQCGGFVGCGLGVEKGHRLLMCGHLRRTDRETQQGEGGGMVWASIRTSGPVMGRAPADVGTGTRRALAFLPRDPPGHPSLKRRSRSRPIPSRLCFVFTWLCLFLILFCSPVSPFAWPSIWGRPKGAISGAQSL